MRNEYEISQIVDSIIKDVVVHNMSVRGKGPYSMASVSFMKDGKEMAIQNPAEPTDVFSKESNINELRMKLTNFIDNRPDSVIERKPNA